DRIVEDILLHSNNNKLYLLNDDIIELVNNNKIEKFYECDKFKIRFKKKRKVNDQVINDRNNLYYECTRFIYNDIDNINDRFKIKTDLLRLSITGIINEKESTFGTFYSHINAEIPYQNKKYFRIDNQWFYLENKFIEQIKKEAINYFQLYKLEEKILNAWHEDLDEDSYNKSHNHQNYYVFDKVIKENIELCDILYINEDNLYLIHVKDEFNTQMRNLSSQIILSAKRLWNDLNNISGSNYFIKTIELYNLRNPKNKLDAQDLFDKISKNKLKVNFVMAYNNRAYKNKTSIEKIEVSESSIAKFSVVQTIKEILVFKRFLIKIIDISEIK
ncbi:MAG: TIGR04141 family sporadically distributed protein, partial [Flavobacteriales bacterium]|nr:TIGR04141 family sporadically distributed protein [Flavobacteriales bacterium]